MNLLPIAEQCAVSAWKKLNQLPLFPNVANMVLPKSASVVRSIMKLFSFILKLFSFWCDRVT